MKSRALAWVWIAVLLVFPLAPKAKAGWQQENLLAGSPAPSMWVTPLVLDFGPVAVNGSSGPLAVTITNTGTSTLSSFAGGGVNAPFGASQNCTGGVAPGGSCQYFFTFSPTAEGIYTATSSSSTNAGPLSIELRGEGVGPKLHVTPLSLDFGNVTLNTTSAQQAVTIRNVGLSTLNSFAGGGVSAPFGAGQNCASGVAPGASCQYLFSFSPTTWGTFTAVSSSSTNAGSFSIDLEGTGLRFSAPAMLWVTPLSVDFGPVAVGDSSGPLVVNITNQGYDSPITDWAGGGVSSPFGAGQDCASGLAAGDTCHFSYSFSPTEPGVFTTTSSVSTSAGSFSVELRGEGIGAGLHASPLVLDFGPVPVGQSGTAQAVTIENTGMSTLSGFAGGGVSAPFSAGQNCASGVAPGATCQFTYNFSPSAHGLYTTTSSVSTNAGSFSILLIGGVDVPFLEQSFVPAQIVPGGTASLRYVIRNPNASATLFGVGFSNAFPSGVSVAAPLTFSASAECGAPSFTPTVGATSISFTDATIVGGDECVVSVDVTAADIGEYGDLTGPVTSDSGTGNTASATLRVGARVYLPLTMR